MSIYIHIPFCTQICSYCDFCKVYKNKKWINDYLFALENEIKTEYKEPKTSEMYVIAKYQQMIDGLVDEILMKEVLVKI